MSGLTPEENETINVLKQKLMRNINQLSDPDRSTRRRSLDKLKRTLLAAKPPDGATPQVMAVFFTTMMQQPLLKTLVDQVEKCRELSCEIITRFAGIIGAADVSELFKAIVPIVASRIGVQPFAEPAEEIRLVLVQLLTSILKREETWSVIPDVIEPLALIMTKSLTDQFPDVKKECTICIRLVAKASKESLRAHVTPLVKAVVANMGHQHSKVRQTGVQALAVLLPCVGADGVEKLLDEKEVLLPMLRKTVYDRTPSVRKAFIKMLMRWLRKIETVHQFEGILLPFLLAGLADENPEIQKFALSEFEELGGEWAVNNADKMGDKMGDKMDTGGEDGGDGDTTMFDFGDMELPEPFKEGGRPSAGCRAMVRRVLPVMLPPILEETADWTANARARAALLLRSIIVYVEEATTDHLEGVVASLSASCRDEEEVVADAVYSCATLLGTFVDTPSLFAILLPQLRGTIAGQDTPQHLTAALVLTAATVQGMSGSQLAAHLQELADGLCQNGLRESEVPELQEALANAVRGVLDTGDADCADQAVSLPLTWVLLQLIATTPADTDTREVAFESLAQLAELCGFKNVDALYSSHLPTILTRILPSDEDDGSDASTGGGFPWKNKAPRAALFDAVLRNCGKAVAESMPQIIPVIIAHLTPSNDPESRLFFLAMLESSLGDPSLNGGFRQFANGLLTDGIMPNAVWRAGRVASTIRKVAVACLYTLLKAGLADQQCLFQTAAQILPVLKGSLDDTDGNTRHLTCLCFQHLFLALPGALSDEPVRQIYPELLKRLDDSSDTVRRSVCLTFAAFLKAAPPVHFKGTVLDYMLDCFFVHLDDSDPVIQDAVLEVLRKARDLDKPLVLKKAQEVRARHRSPDYCDKVIAFCSK
jgi:dynein assembly factor 5